MGLVVFIPTVMFEPTSSKSDKGNAAPSSLASPAWQSSKKREEQEINNSLSIFVSARVHWDLLVFTGIQPAVHQLHLSHIS